MSDKTAEDAQSSFIPSSCHPQEDLHTEPSMRLLQSLKTLIADVAAEKSASTAYHVDALHEIIDRMWNGLTHDEKMDLFCDMLDRLAV